MKKTSITLTEEELEILSLVCHDYKDNHRCNEEAIRPVMDMEAEITEQSNGLYISDTTYNLI